MKTPPYEDLPIIDKKSGFAINRPLGLQGWPGWWNECPDIKERILETRKMFGIVVADDHLK